MRSYPFRLVVTCLIFCFLSFACNQAKQTNAVKKAVYIKLQNGRYTLYRNGQPFFVKGAAGFTNLKRLEEAGGNTIRVWDTTNLKGILDSAQAYHLAVIVGIPMPKSLDMNGFYNTPKAAAHTQKIARLIARYKNHPALLCWCLGNELAFPYKPQFNQFYATFNGIVDMIHRDDPQHPVTTTIMTFQKKNITNIKLRTKIDFISFNIFGSIKTLNEDLEKFKWFWDGPFLISEWGIEGPWTTDAQNAWGAYIENTSTKKAELYLSAYQKYMPVNNSRFLGEMVFYWGQKQELTPTWFSLFDEDGAETEVVQVMQNIWTGAKAPEKAPALKYMLVNDKGANDNIILSPNAIAQSSVYMESSDTSGLKFKWKVYPEDWFKPNGIFLEKQPKEIKHSIIENSGPEVKFKTPDKEGPYRLCVYIYKKNGSFATSNTPFYVVKNP